MAKKECQKTPDFINLSHVSQKGMRTKRGGSQRALERGEAITPTWKRAAVTGRSLAGSEWRQSEGGREGEPIINSGLQKSREDFDNWVASGRGLVLEKQEYRALILAQVHRVDLRRKTQECAVSPGKAHSSVITPHCSGLS